MPPEPENAEVLEIEEPNADAEAQVVSEPVEEKKVDPTESLSLEQFAERRADKIRAMQTPDTPDEEPTAEEEEGAAAAAADAEAALPDDATEAEIAEARETAANEFYAGRYKTREEAEHGIAEKDKTINRLHDERAQLLARLEQKELEEQPVGIDKPAWKDWATSSIESIDDPAAAEALALRSLTEGGYDGYEVFLEAWLASEDSEVRARATIFNNQMMMEVARARAEVAAQTATTQEAQPTPAEEAVQARAQVIAKRPDFGDYEEGMADVVASLDDATRGMLVEMAGRGVEGKAQALDYVYLEARLAKGERRKTAEVKELVDRRAAADRDRLAATTSTSEATPSRTPLSEAEIAVNKMVNARRKEWGLDPLPEE